MWKKLEPHNTPSWLRHQIGSLSTEAHGKLDDMYGRTFTCGNKVRYYVKGRHYKYSIQFEDWGQHNVAITVYSQKLR